MLISYETPVANLAVKNNKQSTKEQRGPDRTKYDMRDKAYRICRDYLNGAWKTIGPDTMVLKQISGGLSNFLYYCALPPGTKIKRKEPSKVLLRMYGDIHGERALDSLVTDSVIFALLSERKLGPRLYGIFPGGRLEEFIPARPLKTCELSDPHLSGMIAEKLATIHSLNVPLIKEPTWLWDTLNKWISNLDAVLVTGLKNPDSIYYAEKIESFNLKEELSWLKNYLSLVGSPVVFCHNDFQEGNILYRESAKTRENQIVIIDFEYCSYNYRGFDLANHFCEWTVNNSYGKGSGFLFTPEDQASPEQKLHFLRSYIHTFKEEMGLNDEEIFKQNGKLAVTLSENFLLKEIETFTLGSHFFWGLWGVISSSSKIPFGYWDYALTRLNAYFDLKSRLLESSTPLCIRT
ncbi:choline/ethanolamine kinase-like isoform X2 [Artemia franciscana]|uniref:Choline/ethanolamine kinase n=1 Tax=Artemia franciscana TaxID=6661 RepID=A0AA88LCC4_ARTSF|nr:hypothetical protein QYM36_004203 [Artemia franciscana]